MRKMLFIIYFFGLSATAAAAAIRTNQIRPLDLQANLLKYHQYDLLLSVDLKPIKGFSILALSKPIEFQLKCGESILDAASLFFDDSMEGKIFTMSIVAKDVRTKCPNGKFVLALNPNGVELDVDLVTATYTLQDLGEDTEGFIQRYKDDRKNSVDDMIYFHSQMSESINSRESFHCLIKGYEQDIMKEEMVVDLVKEYKKIFLFEYSAADIDCTTSVSLVNEINSCTTKPRTAFCGNHRLYIESIAWLKEAREKAIFYKSQLPAALADLKDQLQSIMDEIDTDLKTSVAQTGAV